MKKVINISQTVKISQKLNNQGKKIVLAGGCFDILHSGHIEFLKKAKEQADILFVLLEHDKTVLKLKGKGRPVNRQDKRAQILSSLPQVDYVVILPSFKKDLEYDNLALAIKPAIIASTKGDPGRLHKERQAKMTGGKVVDVIERIPEKSTTFLVNYLHKQPKL